MPDFTGAPTGNDLCPDQENFLIFCLQKMYEFSTTQINVAAQIIPDQHYKTTYYRDVFGIRHSRSTLVNTPSSHSINNILGCIASHFDELMQQFFLNTQQNPGYLASAVLENAAPCSTEIRLKGIDMTASWSVDGLTREGCAVILQNITAISTQCGNKEAQAQLYALFSLLVLLFVIIPAVYAAYQACCNNKSFGKSFREAVCAPFLICAALGGRYRNAPFSRRYNDRWTAPDNTRTVEPIVATASEEPVRIETSVGGTEMTRQHSQTVINGITTFTDISQRPATPQQESDCQNKIGCSNI